MGVLLNLVNILFGFESYKKCEENDIELLGSKGDRFEFFDLENII